MSEESEVMRREVTFDRTLPSSTWRFHMPSVPVAILLLVVGFLVLTPLALMILNSFQIARPGQPIVWGLDGWIKAFSTPGIIKAMSNTFTLALTRQVIALFIGAFFAWLIARTDMPMKGFLEFLFGESFGRILAAPSASRSCCWLRPFGTWMRLWRNHHASPGQAAGIPSFTS